MVLPAKAEETIAAEAEEEEKARRVVKLKTDLEEAEDKARRWGERAERLAAALARAEAGTWLSEDDDDDDVELDDLLDRQIEDRGW